jgi:hypothetical protein
MNANRSQSTCERVSDQPITLAIFFATLALTVVMVIYIPKGFFPTGQAARDPSRKFTTSRTILTHAGRPLVAIRDSEREELARGTRSDRMRPIGIEKGSRRICRSDLQSTSLTTAPCSRQNQNPATEAITAPL